MLDETSPGNSTVVTANASVLEGPRDYVGGLSWGIFVGTFLTWLACCWGNARVGESRWLMPLFGLPLLGELIGSVVLFHRPRRDQRSITFHRFYLGITFLCIGSFQSLWLAYMLYKIDQPPVTVQTLSGLALFAAVTLVGLVIIMTVAIMCSPPRQRRSKDGPFATFVLYTTSILHDLKIGAAQEPFLALVLFFTVFLGVSYLFGFTFAFHDKSLLRASERALYMRNFSTPNSLKPSDNRIAGYFRFQFDSLQAIPDIESNQPNLQTELESLAERKRKNFESLEGVVKYVTAVRPNDALRIIVVGHADEAIPKNGPYLSNYELSQARSENVRHTIIERLAQLDKNLWRNIEWLCLSSSNEIKPLKLEDVVKQLRNKTRRAGYRPAGAYGESVGTEERFAEVHIDQPSNQPTTEQIDRFQVDHPKSLDLIDYIYFANYTITTTGYGDIIPLTPYAKFICSLANICEVFFLVVFFNALLSLKVERDAKNIG